MGLEPMTLRLKVWCSTDWANRATPIHNLKMIKLRHYTVQLKSDFQLLVANGDHAKFQAIFAAASLAQ